MSHGESPAGPFEEDAPTPLFVPVPEQLAELLGYDGESRYVACFWSHDVDEAILFDGVKRQVGESHVFLEYFGHAAVESQLGDLNIGLFEQSATVWLLLDRSTRNLYFAPSPTVRDLLVQQHNRTSIERERHRLHEQAENTLDPLGRAIDQLRAYLDAFAGSREQGE